MEDKIYLFFILLSNTVFCQFADNVAFTLGQTKHLYLSHGEQIAYNKVITNKSATFDPQGSFICRKPGIYAFHFFSLAHTQSKIWIELYKNTNYICSVYGYTSHGYADAGNSVLLHLNLNDHVSIRTHQSYNTTLFGTDDEIYTTFSGILLSSDLFEHAYEDVTFSMGIDHHFHATNGEIVKYNKLIVESDAYNPLTGVFTAPEDGTYIFHYHGLAQNNQLIWLELYHNKDYVNAAYGHTVSGFADAGNTAILHLRSGDHVYIKTRNNRAVDLFGTPNEVYATFSGILLAPITHDSDDSQSETSFSAGLSHHFSGTTLIFDRIFSNRGGGYSPATGYFTARESGIYVFHFHALSRSDAKVWAELYHNYHYIDSLYGRSNGEFAAGSNAAVLDLVSGDTVFLKSRQSTNSYFGAPDEVYCTFSGYKINLEEQITIGNPGQIIG
ncbi:uncharacterized protein LOC133187307 [Saccostrea echinata]|uniref:uncharacterized protein LOC133187307 n=1 Tax=Saccostrea echinata TaxID=191078 RepID=UPI002A823CDC|nr:uncharacterized protein LOC133187307 [Saccostrea echinata]